MRRVPNIWCWFCGHDWIWRELLGLQARVCRRCSAVTPRETR